MTLDGICDHTAVNADDEIHRHYTELLRAADHLLQGRITYQLMEYWPTVLENPTGNYALDEFAVAIDKISKIVFSRTLEHVGWKNTRLLRGGLKEEVEHLRRQAANDVLIGSRSLIITLLNLELMDELQLCVHPVVAGKGLPLFESVNQRINFKLLKTKTFACGAVVFYYAPEKT